ncbi:MAG: DUF3179 domain-containing protein [Saprospiraceae bacterium]|nr:DUF3179 domain-containing protein [Saprospiraceae bacterium]
MRFLSLLLVLSMFMACSDDTEQITQTQEEESVRNTDWDPCDSPYRDQGYIYERNNQTYLWAGEDSTWHFNITDWELNECNLKYGLGRESFPALMDPQYVNISDVTNKYADSEQCLVLYSVNTTKVYPYQDMIRYEVINEVSDGSPVMIAYCVLADLGAIYTRNYCGHTLTFALTGYTYYEPEVWGGLDAFVLWDRDTESLWWPLIDKAISGNLHGTLLEKHDEGNWEILRWSEIKERFPSAQVIQSGQDQPVPSDYPRIPSTQLNCN